MLRAFAISTCLLTCLVGNASAQYRPYGGPQYGGPQYGGPQFYGCVVYEHRDFLGAELPIRGNASIGFVGLAWNDRISSLACSPRCELTSFEHANFGGRSQTWVGSVPYVGPRWNDRISSIIVQCR